MRPQKLVGARHEHSCKDADGTDRAEKPLFNGLMDIIVVGMVGLQRIEARSFRRAIQEVGVPE